MSTIRFSATLTRPSGNGEGGAWCVLTLPTAARATLPPQGPVMVEGTINAFPLRIPVESSGEGGPWIEANKAILEAVGAGAGESVLVEITRVGDEPETRVPAELEKALADAPSARAAWADITPTSRRDWVLWITTAKQEETRGSRIEKACDMLAGGKRRVCCFPGLTWLRKEHPKAGEPWGALPKSGRR